MDFKGNSSDLREGARIVTNMAEIDPRYLEDQYFCTSLAATLIAETERDDLPKLRMKKTGEALRIPDPQPPRTRGWTQGDWRVIVMQVPTWHPNAKLAGKHVVRIDCLCEEERG